MSTHSVLHVTQTEDFTPTGRGDHPAWATAAATPLTARHSPDGHDYATTFKVMYSSKGLYVFIDCVDPKLSAKRLKDADNLFTQDVVEIFLWPCASMSVYFEYNMSPYGAELPILVPNRSGKFHGWLPWHYIGDRQTKRATHIRGGPAEEGASITGWSAEVFIPTKLLIPLGNLDLKPGVEWRANVYRIDYDTGQAVLFQWNDVKGRFHDFKNFGIFRFV